MATMLDIVTRAYRKIRVVGMGESLDDESAVDGLDQLNNMLHEWKLRGVDITHSDLTLVDDFPLDPQFRDGTVHMLASRLSPDYARPREFDADDFFRAIQAAYMVIEGVTFSDGLTNLPSMRHREGGYY